MRWAAIMGLDELLAKLAREAVTPETPGHTGGVTGEALQILACTRETPVTPRNSNAAADAQADGLTGGKQGGDDLDDRRLCTQCGNLHDDMCSIAFPGGVVSAIVGYRPVLDVLHRCAGYVPR